MGKQRNESIDVFRGFAMLLVVLGHTISSCSKDYETTTIINIIWTLQMPMFIIISGYVTKYSKKIESLKEYCSFIKKRTCAYLIPWLAWTILIRGIVFQQRYLLNVKNLLWHMDSGYWFLFTIWTISLIFGTSQYLAHCINKKDGAIKNVVPTLLFTMIGAALLFIIGYFMGLSFLCIKLTLYYIPFYCCGYVFSVVQAKFSSSKLFDNFQFTFVALLFVLYLCLIKRYDFYVMNDGIWDTILRIAASLSGCIAVFGLGEKLLHHNAMIWVGKNSLNIYLWAPLKTL